jgi:hypothetical protein
VRQYLENKVFEFMIFEGLFAPIAAPLGWVLMRLYEFSGSYALSLILIAIFVRVILLPVQMKAKRGQLRLSQLDQNIATVLALIAHAGHEDPTTAEAAYQAAIACSPATTAYSFPAEAVLSLAAVSQSLAHLALTAPPYRKKLLDACAVAIRHDGIITPVENELLRAFAQSLDCPAPLVQG